MLATLARSHGPVLLLCLGHVPTGCATRHLRANSPQAPWPSASSTTAPTTLAGLHLPVVVVVDGSRDSGNGGVELHSGRSWKMWKQRRRSLAKTDRNCRIN